MNMQNSANTRKRPASGASPMVQQPNMSQQQYPYDTNDFTNFDFSNPLSTDQNYSDPSAFDSNNFSYNLNTAQPQTYTTGVAGGTNNLAPVPSTELVRRSRNQQLAPQNGGQQEQWNGFGGNMGNNAASAEDEDEQDLDMKVALAKKDAQGKRKQIPPFVQKLSSFLDSNNTDLIRWSDDGRSFIVLDEDEFARTLIPELFKHNNYASFVRQLNMYGFHKTVNITDGSLRQSEKARKGVKPPSMYSHPYFRKNRPDLLWLIQKPSGKTTAKRKRDGNMKDQYDSDDERQYSPVPEGRPQELSAAAGTSQDLAQLPRNELAAVRQELQKLQSQQNLISRMITQLKDQNEQFYRQANQFQALHDRHESSINAILTFLATFYNRSLEGHGAQNLVNMFTNPQNQQQGSVVEEYNEPTPALSNQVQRFIKRPPLLLPGPTATNYQNLQPGSAVTEPSSARASVSPPGDSSARGSTSSAPPERQYPQSASAPSPNVKSEAQTPNLNPNQVPEKDQMMSLINNMNATSQSQSAASTPAIDMHSLVDRINNGNPLTPQQRDNAMLGMLRHSGDAAANSNNALTTPMPQQPFDFKQLEDNNKQLDYLQKLQREQEARVQELTNRVTPLSPTGTIPGLADLSNQDPFDALGAPGEYDPSAFLDFNDDASFDPNQFGNGDGDDGDFDFGFDTSAGGDGTGTGNWNFGGDDGAGDNMFGAGTAGNDATSSSLAPISGNGNEGGGRVESVSSEATSPAAQAVEEQQEPGTPSKRQRRQ